MTIFDDETDAVVSSHLSYQASAEQRAKESTLDSLAVLADPTYNDHLYATAATTVASVPGVTYSSFEEYLDRVDQFLNKLKANRS